MADGAKSGIMTAALSINEDVARYDMLRGTRRQEKAHAQVAEAIRRN